MTLAEMIGYGLAAITAVGGVILNRRKHDIDESALVLGKWKELVDQHQSAIKELREEFASYKSEAVKEIADLRQRLRAAENRISELEAENAGLKRAIAQNSQSTATFLGRALPEDSEAIKALDRAGHNRRKGDV
jgi:DNA repair exonuclease SbcCD ATPase subunit